MGVILLSEPDLQRGRKAGTKQRSLYLCPVPRMGGQGTIDFFAIGGERVVDGPTHAQNGLDRTALATQSRSGMLNWLRAPSEPDHHLVLRASPDCRQLHSKYRCQYDSLNFSVGSPPFWPVDSQDTKGCTTVGPLDGRRAAILLRTEDHAREREPPC